MSSSDAENEESQPPVQLVKGGIVTAPGYDPVSANGLSTGLVVLIVLVVVVFVILLVALAVLYM